MSNTLIGRFHALADHMERVAAHPVAFLVFMAWCILAPTANIDVANYVISVVTASLLFVLIGPSRRDRKAIHVKLDDLEDSIEEADSGNVQIEDKPEAEIDERRKRKRVAA